MASPSNALHPDASAGRAHGISIHRTPSRESLTAHPLLSPTPGIPTSSTSTPPVDIASSPTSTSTTATPPRYAPYTPKHHRPIPVSLSPTTQSTVASAPVSKPVTSGPAGSATSKLQMQNLKAAAQTIGLNAGSLGWNMLEALVNEGNAPEWEEVWSAITIGKATMLLPAEDAGSEANMVEVVRDHVVYLDHDSHINSPAVTLTGLRGTLDSSVLTFQSTLSTTSKPFSSLQTPSSRSSTLASLPPLPEVPATFPSFTVYRTSVRLPLPPRITKPPLPPRPGTRGAASTAVPGQSRIANPFASLFGGRSSTPPPPPPAPPTIVHTEPEHVIEIEAVVMDRRVVRQDVCKQMSKSLTTAIDDSLRSLESPQWIIDRVQNFVAPLLPAPKPAKRGSTDGTIYLPESPLEETPDQFSQALQSFYATLEDELRTDEAPASVKKDDGSLEVDEKADKEKQHSEEKIQYVLQNVESIICTFFYDRLFRPFNSDDAQHDEALASRIAALNLLDLGLEHLGIDADGSAVEVGEVVKKCGKALSNLELSHRRAPVEKATVLVSTHRIAADGLSKLPSIRLKPEGEMVDQATPKASNFASNAQSSKPVSSELPDGKALVTPLDTLNIPRSDSLAPTKSETSAESLKSPLSLQSPAPEVAESPMQLQPALSVEDTDATQSNSSVVASDLLLPIIIYSVVKANPAHLVSHLLYVQRYRNNRIGGEEGFCLINLMAVVEFLEHVDLAALGLGDSERVMSTEDLTPITLSHGAIDATTSSAVQSASARLRGRVVQEVDALAGSANKVITGVVDSSFGVIKGLLTSNPEAPMSAASDTHDPPPWNRPGFGLLRRGSTFSIANVAASLPGAGSVRERGRSVSQAGEEGQQMVEVSSRPGSVREVVSDSDAQSQESESEAGEGSDAEEESEADHGAALDSKSDARSVRSFSSMMSSTSRDREREKKDRKSLSDRLANVSGLSKFSNPRSPQRETPSKPPQRRASLLPPPKESESSTSSRSPSPIKIRIAPPKTRFLECTVDDLRLSEVGDLLQEYRRVVEGLQAMDGFTEK
ncbi:hypothetical protein SISNIDRAFT_453467 [Sistotremastrum niveocremeum HHB9708]|uniref:VPS9 domain-containing protein n=1 Tax=Sistotremastrum niveocremeum HHB9708 TaxID=1314777 RepID=A0A164VWK8_9AGAM|nr:hypothetical protein SISNIDRAFT_453467 [Sistotremastrum niveocremeum HHB9708]